MFVNEETVEVGCVVRVRHSSAFRDGVEYRDAHVGASVTPIRRFRLVSGTHVPGVGHFHCVTFFLLPFFHSGVSGDLGNWGIQERFLGEGFFPTTAAAVLLGYLIRVGYIS